MSARPRPRASSRHRSRPQGLLEMGSRAGDPGQHPAGLCSAASLAPTQGLEAASPASRRQPLPCCRASSPVPTHTVCLCLSAKAGVCPDPATEEANCTVGCQSDGDCESTLKCCPAACGKACQEPNGNGPLPQPRGCCKPSSRELTAPGLPGLGSSVGLGARCVSGCSTAVGPCGIRVCSSGVAAWHSTPPAPAGAGHARPFLLPAARGGSEQPPQALPGLVQRAGEPVPAPLHTLGDR